MILNLLSNDCSSALVISALILVLFCISCHRNGSWTWSRLEQFLQVLPRNARHAIEFRDPSWYVDEVLDLLRGRDVALCLHDKRGSASERVRVASFVYVRFHGPLGQYAGGYSAERRRAWASWLTLQFEDGADVYAYFNNDVGGHAPRDAVALRRRLEIPAC